MYDDRPPPTSWWRHQMETIFGLLAICAGNSPVTGEFPAQRPVTRSFGVFFDLHLNKRLSKQSWGWWFETPSRPLWRHCNDGVCWCHGTKQTAGHQQWLCWIYYNNRVAWNMSCNTDIVLQPLTHLPLGQNGRHLGRRHFQLYFLEWKW